MTDLHLHLPPEILDYIIDLLHDESETLKRCCLVSKSWVPRTRIHLFADIKFRSASDLESWKKTFPVIANSPARQAHTLFVGCARHVVAADAEEGGWIRAFSGVKHLDVDNNSRYLKASEVSLTPFYSFSPNLKSLRISPIIFPFPQVFDLILSSPLLEDLTLDGSNESWFHGGNLHRPQTIAPLTSPVFSGTLIFHISGGAGNPAGQLLDLPNGLHFRNIALSWGRVEDLWWITELVEKCSHTLESLDIDYTFRLGTEPTSFDLSKATKLRDATFRPESQNVEWITMALQTITPEHRDFRQISIYLPTHLTFWNIGADIKRSLGEATSRGWSDLDYLLVQFWEAFSIRPRVGCERRGEKGQNTEYCIECLLPEITERGIVDPL